MLVIEDNATNCRIIRHRAEQWGMAVETAGNSRDALALLARAAFFAPGEPIPRALLLTTADIAADDVQAALRGERQRLRQRSRVEGGVAVEQEAGGPVAPQLASGAAEDVEPHDRSPERFRAWSASRCWRSRAGSGTTIASG